MGFDVSKFVTQAGSSVVDRATNGAVSSASGVALGASVLASGASLNALQSVVSSGIEQIAGNAIGDIFSKLKSSILGQVPGRCPPISPQALDKLAGRDHLSYPDDLGEYMFRLQFQKYRRPVPLGTSVPTITQTIYLPLPKELHSGHSIDLQAGQTGFVGSVANAALLAHQNRNKDALQQIQADNREALGAGAALWAAGAIPFVGDQLQAIGSQTFGIVTNPNLSVTFQGPQLRQFQFTWEFSPNNEAESKKLQQILESIQQRALTRYMNSGSSAILAYPETCTPHALPDGPGNIGDLIRFKNSMINSVDVNYAPNGIPSFFKGTKAPTFIGLSIAFQEIEYFTSSDYNGDVASGISVQGSQITAAVGSVIAGVGQYAKGILTGESPPAPQQTPPTP